jgi:hypothetical protein
VIPGVPDFGIGPAPEPGRVDEVAPGVRRLTAPNPGLMTGPGTNTYLIGRAGPVVVDPGPADESHTDAIVAAAGPLGSVRAPPRTTCVGSWRSMRCCSPATT